MDAVGINQYESLLRRCPLFQDVPDASYADSLRFLKARMRSFAKGECLFQPGGVFHHAGIVLEGSIECSFHNEHFDRIIMNRFSRGAVFGQSMACAEVACCPMQICAVTDCTVLFLDFRVLLAQKPLRHAYQMQLAANCIRDLARQNVFLNLKARILGQRGVRDRIFVYLRSLPMGNGGNMRIPFTKTALAEFLGVNRSALSRELRRMENEGLLSMNGRDFRLLP